MQTATRTPAHSTARTIENQCIFLKFVKTKKEQRKDKREPTRDKIRQKKHLAHPEGAKKRQEGAKKSQNGGKRMPTKFFQLQRAEFQLAWRRSGGICEGGC